MGHGMRFLMLSLACLLAWLLFVVGSILLVGWKETKRRLLG